LTGARLAAKLWPAAKEASMPRLDFYVDFKPFVKIKLESSDVVVGRSSECTVQLADERVSRKHAVIRQAGDGYTIEDTSAHGTRVNDQMVKGPTVLKPGDRIYIEKFIIIYQPDDDGSSEPIEAEKTFIGKLTPNS
jgi:pSer/pThr/pTyr-binding forkhead associated (FHA) protein